jgi:hypothetical protein
MKRELSGRFDYKPVPDLKFKAKKFSDKIAPNSMNQTKEKTSKPNSETSHTASQKIRSSHRDELESSAESSTEQKYHENIRKSTREIETEPNSPNNHDDTFGELDQDDSNGDQKKTSGHSREQIFSEDDGIASKSKLRKSKESKI